MFVDQSVEAKMDNLIHYYYDNLAEQKANLERLREEKAADNVITDAKNIFLRDAIMATLRLDFYENYEFENSINNSFQNLIIEIMIEYSDEERFIMYILAIRTILEGNMTKSELYHIFSVIQNMCLEDPGLMIKYRILFMNMYKVLRANHRIALPKFIRLLVERFNRKYKQCKLISMYFIFLLMFSTKSR